ncbi:MAG TPA: SUMF1/EgtB/PvdO family nonheme iron enzyme, partial [Kofleriaceae bacterium]|nr:SUMF1/EgtB/PvdO family nonheme iron enzyme [Kofleriaceae bacterium]
GAGGAAVLALGAVAGFLVIRAEAGRELDAVVGEQLRAATGAREAARQIAQQRDAARARAFELFGAHRWSEGEDAWSAMEAMAAEEERQYRLASGHLESALRLDPGRDGLHDRFADLTFERLLRAERDRDRHLADELAGRLAAHDSGRHGAKLAAAARVELDIAPAGTQVWTERPGAPRQLVGVAPLAALLLPPGSATFALEAPGHVPARLPVLLAREETLRLAVVLPPAAAAPPGMIYVPPGRFLFGSADGTDLRRGFLNAAPLHEVWTDGYFIGRTEVTFGEWIEFLDDLPPDERRRRTPGSVSPQTALTLTELGPRQWRLDLRPTTRTYTAELGQRLRYEGRARRAEQDWTRFPVASVSYEDAIAYAAWLDRTRRIPGARLCNEHEWERAARGADGRSFPSGEALAPGAANIDTTYGRHPLAFGPDEVGSHPGSRSPVGADDMAGNVWEWARSVEVPDAPVAPVARGGSWYLGALAARSTNREYVEPTTRHPLIGVRLCITPHESIPH